MKLTLKEISKLLNGSLTGDENVIITGAGDIESAGPGQIAFIKDKTYLEKAKISKASAIIVPKDLSGLNNNTIHTENPYLAFAKVLEIIYSEKENHFKGIHKTAIIGSDVKLGHNVSVGAYSVISDNAVIGDNTVICSNVYIGDRTIIGKAGYFYPNATIREDCEIGNNVIIHSGTVIGSDGFGYVPVKEKYYKIPQIGKVILEDDVEIGSNSSIDRATIDKTVIGRGTKIDNQVHVAHNVIVGENSILLAHVTIAGSTILGKHVIFSGQSGAIDNLKVGDNVVAASRAAILQDVPANSVVWGNPAAPILEEKRRIIALKALPELIREVKTLKKKIEESGKNK
ncbi:MAG: UDP-3-O-(3-hydroxymyristoyl)glucosamine N-acyltransferase [Elusimicrobia bacterium]|nr:UDP-3-O-(3-hydroxymyristoyl)glucosamine N-acyltransferase [Elusimicrobiota bacterium]MBU2614521.1 UDP-3-O-(3-hydroxymyristoyl)glucosamine N-acyltransferase [Elusimicrobiota bacterium]